METENGKVIIELQQMQYKAANYDKYKLIPKSNSESLSFDEFRIANMRRVVVFKNAKGEIAHPSGIEDWSPAQWFQAFEGEVGEYANFRKKYERGDISLEEFNEKAPRELADAVTYLDLLAARLGFDLGEWTKLKFNEVSDRVGAPIKLANAFLYTDHSITKQTIANLEKQNEEDILKKVQVQKDGANRYTRAKLFGGLSFIAFLVSPLSLGYLHSGLGYFVSGLCLAFTFMFTSKLTGVMMDTVREIENLKKTCKQRAKNIADLKSTLPQ